MPHISHKKPVQGAQALEPALLSLLETDAEAAAQSGRDGLATRREGLTSLDLAAAVYRTSLAEAEDAVISNAQLAAVRRALSKLEGQGLVEQFGYGPNGVVWVLSLERERLRALTPTSMP